MAPCIQSFGELAVPRDKANDLRQRGVFLDAMHWVGAVKHDTEGSQRSYGVRVHFNQGENAEGLRRFKEN